MGVLLKDGSYAELSYGATSPEVSGTATIPGLGELGSGNVGVDFSTVALSFKYDVTDRIPLAVVVDLSFGADVDYGDADPGYPTAGSSAEFRSSSATVLGRYEVNDRFSVHGGARRITTDVDLFMSAGGGSVTYDAEYDQDSDTAFVLGAAYERPETALRSPTRPRPRPRTASPTAPASLAPRGRTRTGRWSTSRPSPSLSTSAPASPRARSCSGRSAGRTGPRR